MVAGFNYFFSFHSLWKLYSDYITITAISEVITESSNQGGQHDNLERTQVGLRTIKPRSYQNIEVPMINYSDYHIADPRQLYFILQNKS